jgi:hypothetical protein
VKVQSVDLRLWLHQWGREQQDICAVDMGIALFAGEHVRWDTQAVSCRAVIAVEEGLNASPMASESGREVSGCETIDLGESQCQPDGLQIGTGP